MMKKRDLDIKMATDYAMEHLVGLGYEDVVIASGKEKNIGGERLITLKFSFASEFFPDGSYSGEFDVWMQHGTIYGEW